MKKSKKIMEIIGWILTSFYVGIGILVGFTILQIIFDKFGSLNDSLDNIFVRIIFLTIVGGIAIFIYKFINKSNKSSS